MADKQRNAPQTYPKAGADDPWPAADADPFAGPADSKGGSLPAQHPPRGEDTPDTR
jgi:hypothetical protein